MQTAEMTARAAEYTALVDTINAHGATKLHANERDRLFGAADALLFGDPDADRLLDLASAVVDQLESTGRWLPDSARRLRTHLRGCGPAA